MSPSSHLTLPNPCQLPALQRPWLLQSSGYRPPQHSRRGECAAARAFSRREGLSLLAAGLLLSPAAAQAAPGSGGLETGQPGSTSPATAAASGAASAASPAAVDIPNYAAPGPFVPVRLPELEHLCTNLFPQCTADQCLIRVNVVYPKGGSTIGERPSLTRQWCVFGAWRESAF
jgi:hypothetical protein